MAKSATGTEYVNAQTEELKTEIDKLAGEIEAPGYGLVYTELFTSMFAYVQVVLVTDEYRQQTRCTLQIRGGEWNGMATDLDKTVYYYGSMSVAKDGAIPEAYRPPSDITYSGDIYWRSGTRGGGTVNINVSTSGRIQVSVTGSGYFNRTFTYML